ncbi:MAG: single-stranded-DNA-specific exonuclease RecJ [Kiritimatiellae bacterium]|jgi:single-stranded-DNA-specific exonuclease|nr:single-stranded-DNA-specific exonuclease RecJ [Kiritimatiellia bacterium]
MQSKYKWDFQTVEEDAALELSRKIELPLVIARILVSRGIQSKEEARRFLSPNIKRDLASPFLFPGVEEAVERIWAATQKREHIVIFGDFDVDGISASVILHKALSAVGADAEVFLPLRDKEGYGLSFKAIERCLAECSSKPALFITVDCGIGSVQEVARLRELDIDVVITDHHECGETLPDAVAMVNPHLGASPGAETICGAGVAFKVAHALVQRAAGAGVEVEKGLAGRLVVPVGLATVADIVPLTGENRLFASSAMKLWTNYAGEGLHALMTRAQQRSVDIPNSYIFGFVLGPRINASGRMGSAMVAYELMMTTDKDRAKELAARLEGFNGERRGVQMRILELARKQCGLADGECVDAAIVVGGVENPETNDDGWHPGVAGIVASQLSEESGKPAAVIVLNKDGGGRGSVRAGAAYHALEALASADEALEGFGGHARAAGFQLKPFAFEKFKELFCKACEEQTVGVDLSQSIKVTDWIMPDQISYEMAEYVQQLAPFGMGNRMPLWAMHGVLIENVRTMGTSGEHMQFIFKTGDEKSVRAIWFKCGNLSQVLKKGDSVDVVFELAQSDFRGFKEIELKIVDMRK